MGLFANCITFQWLAHLGSGSSVTTLAYVGFHKKLDNKAQSLLRPEGLYVGELCATETSNNTTLINWCPKDNETTVVQSTAQAFLTMSPEDRGEVIAQIGAEESQDFQTT